ncbi:ribosomal protein S18 [Myriangium duriaei CBS 260.36]|uniref:Small ribosomal subunit protein bS18m n=1 Tax=Myriangium duriaei CBS 260.36 TaxID=1168546 RepID=A0A9P4MIL7_9PEZI|nr:ribosomal protein S18 [Myriangium duriaei CBS 260.36]
MFVCRVCRGEQKRLFSSSRTLLDTASPPTRLTENLTKMRQGRALQPPQATQSAPPRQARPVRGTPMSGFNAAGRAIDGSYKSPRDVAKDQQQARDMQQKVQDRQDMERQMGRVWHEGDVYAPHDLSSAEMQKWRTPKAVGKQSRDICDMLGINPLDHYKNFSIMSEYVTEMGRIKGRNETGLRPINQRRMAKAIRRAVGCGLMPSVHRHPEIMRDSIEQSTMGASGRTGRR